MNQPRLPFPDWPDDPDPEVIADARAAARKMLAGLYSLRQSNRDSPFLPAINETIASVRDFLKSSHTQIEEFILYAIETQQCWTEADLIDETKLSRTLIRHLVARLAEQDLIKQPPRYIPGSDRQYYLIKSTRRRVGEMAAVL